MAAPHRARRLLRNSEEEARTDACLDQGGARPCLPHQRAGKRVNPAINNASARQRSGGPAPVLGRGSDRNSRTRNTDIAEVERQIAGDAHLRLPAMDSMLQRLGLKEGEAIIHPWVNKA